MELIDALIVMDSVFALKVIVLLRVGKILGTKKGTDCYNFVSNKNCIPKPITY